MALDTLQPLLGWLRDLLYWHIAVTRQAYGALADDEYRGLYVPDAEIDLLLAQQRVLTPDLQERRLALATQRAALDCAPLDRIATLFGLDDFARDVLLLTLAPELDLRFERIYAYIQDDVTRKRPSVNLALSLFCLDSAARVLARDAFAPDAPLRKHLLVQLYDDGQRNGSLLARMLRLDERIAADVLGTPRLDAQLLAAAEISTPQRDMNAMVLPNELRERLERMVTEFRIQDSGFSRSGAASAAEFRSLALLPQAAGMVLGLHGNFGSGRRALAEALCNGQALLSVQLSRLHTSADTPRENADELVQRVLREARLRTAAILWLDADELLYGSDQVACERFLRLLDAHPGLSFLVLGQPWDDRGSLRTTTYIRIDVPAPTYSGREQLWRQRLNGDSPGDETLQVLASTFRLSGGQIRAAATMARTLARWRSGEAQPTIKVEELFVACRAQSSGKLDSLAHKVGTTYSWHDIVLPAEQLAMLREVCIQVRHRRIVLESWGFDKHLAMGKGVNVLFAGTSGTGKTMAAEIVAGDLGLELYKIDLSMMVSKYIGETEKNLDKIFTAAREANAILFFDEADAIFGKRSEVKDAHDRYANIEVGYLLQKMESYDGVVILATNLRKNLDDAFVRRLHVAIEFPFPEEPDRQRIWRKVFPPDAPLAADVDVGFLAKQFKLAGGNIRNIALLSAYLAAEDGEHIRMRHIVRAVKREYQKMGKLVTKGEFGEHLEKSVAERA
ncbi:ATP-binding protein [Candidatus Gracilibacteria bacterium]|nr:ATP-binding protein [Candidatus Gracilibacteria bacterium]